jgi:hypothetical protein
MPALNFINHTGNSRFSGIITYNSIEYDFIIYITPLVDPNEIQEIVNYFGTRVYNGKPCLGIRKTSIAKMINSGDVSAFFIVRVSGVDNVASGTLQMYDWCDLTNDYDVWINDVCKIAPDKQTGSIGKPVDVMFMLMEQLVVQNLGKTNIKLFVSEKNKKRNKNYNIKDPNASFLKQRYNNIGYNIEPSCDNKFKNENVMEKSSLVPDTSIIDYAFLQIPPQQQPPEPTQIGGDIKRKGYKTKTYKKKLINKKTYRRK